MIFCFCLKIKFADALLPPILLTNSSQSISIDSNIYLPANISLRAHDDTKNQINLDIDIINHYCQQYLSPLSNNKFLATFIETHLYDAQIYIFVKSANVTKTILINSPTSVSQSGDLLILEVNAATYELSKITNPLVSKLCRASLGDSRCGVILEEYKREITIQEVVDFYYLKLSFPQEDRPISLSEFDYGTIQIIGHEFKSQIYYNLSPISLRLGRAFPQSLYKVVPLNAYLYPGCDKTIETCYRKFNNCSNFRGEPFVS